jgi:hypothetical protein
MHQLLSVLSAGTSISFSPIGFDVLLAVEKEIKGSLRKKDTKRRKKMPTPAPDADVTDSRLVLQQAQQAQALSVKEEQAEKARSRANTLASAKGGVYDNVVKGTDAAPAEALSDDDDEPVLSGDAAPLPCADDEPVLAAPPSPAVVPASKGPPPTQAPIPKSLAARLGGSIRHSVDYKTTLEADEERRGKATKLFKAPDQHDNRSKIFQALNPKPLWYESRREKEEAADDANVSDVTHSFLVVDVAIAVAVACDCSHRIWIYQHVDIRGNGVAALLASRDYAEEQGLPGTEFNEVLSEDEDEDEDGEEGDGYDTDNAVRMRTGCDCQQGKLIG